MDISIRFGLVESTEEQWDLIKKGILNNQTSYTISKDLVEWLEEDNYLKREAPYGSRLVIKNENDEIIAWRRMGKSEKILEGNLRKISKC
jgi:hypothetical protein